MWIKREDLSGLAFGGNKTRELEYFIGAAKAAGADVFVAGGGGAQSSHAVQCAAAAHNAGLLPVLVLHRHRADSLQGNFLLTRLLDGDVRFVDVTDVDAAIADRHRLASAMEAVAAEYAAKGHRPYILPSSFHPLGAIGFVDCALELSQQLRTNGLSAPSLYVTSAGATQAGLVLGGKALNWDVRVTGISYTLSTQGLPDRLAALARSAAQVLGLDVELHGSDFENESHAGTGYGIPSPAGMEALHLLATTEGLFLDPVYTAKGMAGLINHVRARRLGPDADVIFLHTGGLPGIFAYASEFKSALGSTWN